MLRLAKMITTASFALWMSLVAMGNLVDYPTNFEFVRHVLSMDTTFPQNRLMGRALPGPLVHHVAYGIIILTELATAALCWWGAIRMFRSRRDKKSFRQATEIAAAGYLLAIVLFFVGFMTIGGEWFAMWQSEVWNGLDPAFRTVTIATLFLLLLYVREDESDPGS